MIRYYGKRAFSLLLVLVMLLGMIPAAAFAEGNAEECTHHPEHVGCAYVEKVEGVPCSHKHDENCGYSEGSEAQGQCSHVCSVDTGCVTSQPACQHQHVDCGYVPAVEGAACQCQPDENGVLTHVENCGFVEAVEGVACSHQCGEDCYTLVEACVHQHVDCGYTPAVEGTACQHKHDENCGFVEAVEGVACDFVCSECSAKEEEKGHQCESEPEEVMLIDSSTAWYCPDCNGIFDSDWNLLENPQLMQNTLDEPVVDGVAINETNFPDAAFRNYIKTNFDKDDSSSLNAEEISAATFFPLSNEGITKLDGIGYFTSLKHLSCSRNPELKTIDVSNNTSLEVLDISYTGVSSIDVSNNANLEELSCTETKIKTLDTSHNPNLKELNCGLNGLTLLNIRSNPLLEILTCHENNLTSLDLSSNPNLRELTCYNNQLISLDLSANTNLTKLTCSNNKLSSLDLTANNALTELVCGGNHLTSLDLSNKELITTLYCGQLKTNTAYEHELAKKQTATASAIWKNGVCQLDLGSLAGGSSANIAVVSGGEYDSAAGILTLSGVSENSSCTVTYNYATGRGNMGVQLTVNIPAKPSTYAVTVTGGNGSGEYPEGAAVTIEANAPETGMRFKEWSGAEGLSFAEGSSANSPTATFTMPAKAVSLTATYENIPGQTLESIAITTQPDKTAYTAGEKFDPAGMVVTATYSDGTSKAVSGYTLSPNTDAELKETDKVITVSYTEGGVNKEATVDITVAVPDGIAINATNFPDANFREFVKSYDANGNGYLYGSELSATTIDCRNKEIADLTGIEHFTAVKQLNCSGNQLTELNLESNTALQSLYCSSNQLGTLDLSKNTALTWLYCSSNKLTELNLSNNSNLLQMDCEKNQLTSLDVSACTKLVTLNCNQNQLTQLDVSKNVKLIELKCRFNKQLSTLNISGCNLLEQLLCDDNQLSALDLSNKTVLRVLWCGQNKLTTLDLSDCAALYYLTCGENQLSSLDASACPELYTLSCGDNQLTALNLTGSPKLFDLYCSDNRLTELDVSKNVALHRLICEQNYLTELDVSACSELYELNCNDNLLTKLDVSKISSLHTLFCHRNKLPEMDISGLSSISTFSGVDQKVEAIAMKDGDKYILDMHDVVSDTSKLGYTVWYSDYDENTCVFSITGADGQKSERVYKYFVDDENKNFIRVNLSITLKDPPTLTGISITTAPTKTAYTVGEIFDPAGMVVTATYSDNSSKVLTEDEYTYAPSTALTADVSSITVSYKDDATKTATQTITVSAAPATYTVTYDANGGTGTMADGTATEGVAFSLPANDFTAPANKQFKAWQIGSAEYQPGDTYTFTANITVKAVWEDIPATAPDYEGAKDAINEQVWAVAQAVANSAEQLKPWIEEEIESILKDEGITDISVSNVVVSDVVPAVAGTAADKDGTDGSFKFTATLSGKLSVRSFLRSTSAATETVEITKGKIVAAPYVPSGHVHDWSEDWTCNSSHHWHECKDSSCKIVDDYDRHSFSAWKTVKHATATTAGLKTRSCRDCGYVQQLKIAAGSSPSTGDTANLPLWMSLMALGLGGLAVTGHKLRTKKGRHEAR